MTRVAVVYPRANIDTVPCLVGAIEELAEHGYDIDLFTLTAAGQPSPGFDSPRVRLLSLGVDGQANLDQATAGLRNAVKRITWLPEAAREPLLKGYRALGVGLAHGSRVAARARGAGVADRSAAYRCVIGVDPDGLIEAGALARGAPLGYYSLELLLSDELTTKTERELKLRERQLSQAAEFVIVQDEARAGLLADDNNLSADQLVLVPNAPAGPARRKPSRYWHTRFDLPSTTRVALHSGSLGDWTGIEQIVESVATWPADWVLVVHTRYDAESSAYVDGLRANCDPRRVRFSLRPVARQDYDALVDGADIGLAFYVASGESAFTQRNVQTIGLSSGKLSHLFKAGVPAIVNRAASISSLIESSGSGIAVEDASQIGAALSRLVADYDAASTAAMRFFTEHLDFQRAFADVLRRIDALPSYA